MHETQSSYDGIGLRSSSSQVVYGRRGRIACKLRRPVAGASPLRREGVQAMSYLVRLGSVSRSVAIAGASTCDCRIPNETLADRQCFMYPSETPGFGKTRLLIQAVPRQPAVGHVIRNLVSQILYRTVYMKITFSRSPEITGVVA